jgi:hypothetical protein
MNADFAIFERLQNIAFSVKDYRAKAVHYPEHPQYGEFLAIVGDPIFANPRVWHDFDYQGAAKMTSDQARERLATAQAVVPNAVAV